MPILCLHCAAQMPETAAFCPGCGRPTPGSVTPDERVGFLPQNIAGALAYLTFLPAVVFLFRPPYNRNRFVRFHSVQCLLLWVAALLTVGILKVAGLVLFSVPLLGPLLTVLISVAAVLAAGLIWLVLVVKALQGERFKLPVLGTVAERYSGSE